jgi:hypothetical protein
VTVFLLADAVSRGKKGQRTAEAPHPFGRVGATRVSAAMDDTPQPGYFISYAERWRAALHLPRIGQAQ